MTDVAIRVENLSKQYRIGPRQRYRTLRDALTDAMYAPFRRLPSLFGNSQSSIRNSQSDTTIWALKDVSFEIKHGEVVGIIGNNGAGKSTLLKILSRITDPTEGYADVRGRVGSLLEVGTGFHPELTGRENIYLNGAILGMRKREIERKLDEIVDFSGVEKFIDTPVKHYSSGMYLRLAFSVAAHLDAEILMVDEVLAVGDVAFQKKCLGKVGEVAKEGRTVLFVSHNLAAVRSLCTRGLLLKDGTLYTTGSTDRVLSLYLAPAAQHKSESAPRVQDVGIVECEALAANLEIGTIPEIFADQVIIFRFTVRNPKERRRRIILGGRLTDLAGNQIGRIDSSHHGVYFDCDPNEVLQVDAINEGLRLAPGSYLFWPEMFCEGILMRSRFEHISLTVLPSDVFGCGYADFTGDGPALWKATWSKR